MVVAVVGCTFVDDEIEAKNEKITIKMKNNV